VVANPTYREVILRSLAGSSRASLPHIAPTWLTPEGRLDTDKLLAAFLEFWREHGEALLGTATYPEIAPHLVLMAFLHRVENGGGVLNREYAVRRGRIDLVLRLGQDRVAMELKVWRDGGKDPRPQGSASSTATSPASASTAAGSSSSTSAPASRRSRTAPAAKQPPVQPAVESP
jgi:hypothetical protein